MVCPTPTPPTGPYMPVPKPNDICEPYFKNHSATVVLSWSFVEEAGGPISRTASSKVNSPILSFQSGFGVEAHPASSMAITARNSPATAQPREARWIFIASRWQNESGNQAPAPSRRLSINELPLARAPDFLRFWSRIIPKYLLQLENPLVYSALRSPGRDSGKIRR
jgi:hypothetical protein